MNDDATAAASFQTHTSIRQLTEDEILAVSGGVTAISTTVNGVTTYTVNGKVVGTTPPLTPPFTETMGGQTIILAPGLAVVSSQSSQSSG